MEVLGIIPARFASTRFPGKALADIGGKPMVQRVYEQANKVIATLFIATDNEKIEKTAQQFGGQCIMTSSAHQSGTDRCYEALQTISSGLKKDFDIVVNIQGDEPFVQTAQIQALIDCFEKPEVEISTLVKKIDNPADIFNPNYPKVILDTQGRAIYFSRSPIPFIRNVPEQEWHTRHTFYKHLGMYAYRCSMLKKICSLPPSSLEKAEALEQNRWIEHGMQIYTAETTTESYPVDIPADIEKLKQLKLI